MHIAEKARLEKLLGMLGSSFDGERANAARMIDLDLLDFQGKTATGGPGRAILPHPRMAARAFVLQPLADLAPAWRHPVSGTPIQALLAALPVDQTIERL